MYRRRLSVHHSLGVHHRPARSLAATWTRSLASLVHPSHHHAQHSCLNRPPRHTNAQSTSRSPLPFLSSLLPPRRGLFGFSAPKPVSQTIRRRVPFAPATFFSVILDVSSYHLFLPFCVSSKVLSPPRPSPSSPSSSSFSAELTVGFRMFTESYRSLITYHSPSTISVKAIESAIFDHLNSSWRFLPVSNSPDECDVEFTIDFLVGSRLHAGAVQMFFGDVTEQQMKAFIKRCREVEENKKREEQGKGVKSTTSPQALATAVTKPAAMDGPPPVHMTAQSIPSSSSPSPTTPSRAKSTPAPASLPSRPSAPVHPPTPSTSSSPSLPTPSLAASYSPPVHFTAREVEQLRTVFREYASGREMKANTSTIDSTPSLSQITDEHTQQPPNNTTSSPSPSTSSPSSSTPHLSNGQYVNEQLPSSSSPLQLSFPSFLHACAFLSSPHSGVFSKYRERASLRACAEDESIAHACFASQPTLYRYSGSGLEGEDATPVFVHSHPLHNARAPAHLPGSSAGGGGGSAKLSTARSALSFGEFLEVMWGLVRATNGERLYTVLMKAAREGSTAGSEHLTAARMKTETLAFFALQLGVIRQVMPAMVVRRSRDLDKELGIHRLPSTGADSDNSPSSAPLADPSGRGLYLLAMVGLMESVLSETEKAIGDAMTLLLHQVQIGQGSSGGALSVKEWTDWWDRQAELLAVLTVPGQSSLIQWASATQTAESFATSHTPPSQQTSGRG